MLKIVGFYDLGQSNKDKWYSTSVGMFSAKLWNKSDSVTKMIIFDYLSLHLINSSKSVTKMSLHLINSSNFKYS